ncbi:MAG TPA: hypothetical protein VLH58_10110 [Candidatus Methylomirabilis sp.]|nr:hypothetical protein [Candidatus Methylomirabilis sp.]
MSRRMLERYLVQFAEARPLGLVDRPHSNHRRGRAAVKAETV